MRILNHNSIVSFRNDMHGALLEIRKSAIRNLKVTVDCYASCGMISLITDKITADQVYRSSREPDQGGELLIKPIWNRF